MKMRNRAKIRISKELQHELLKLPWDINITGCTWDFDIDAVVLYVEGVSLPDIPDGGIPPFVDMKVKVTFE